jgi:hypothetical protein
VKLHITFSLHALTFGSASALSLSIPFAHHQEGILIESLEISTVVYQKDTQAFNPELFAVKNPRRDPSNFFIPFLFLGHRHLSAGSAISQTFTPMCAQSHHTLNLPPTCSSLLFLLPFTSSLVLSIFTLQRLNSQGHNLEVNVK